MFIWFRGVVSVNLIEINYFKMLEIYSKYVKGQTLALSESLTFWPARSLFSSILISFWMSALSSAWRVTSTRNTVAIKSSHNAVNLVYLKK